MLNDVILADNEQLQSKFMVIYKEYHSYLYDIIYKILKNHYQSEEILQISFCKAAKNIDKIDMSDKNRLKKYLKTIARNTSYTWIKKVKKQYDNEILHGDFADNKADMYYEEPLDIVVLKAEIENLYNALNQLKAQEKDMVLMHYFYEYSLKEIAELTGISYEAAKKRMQRIVKKLYKILQNGGFYE